ncbi:hypothetical protein F4811DRAFT_569412 [Daldinia bambusicola]|nr:hypothetical protein F4811DRAFT_569412 [Daldinia bambusicola]
MSSGGWPGLNKDHRNKHQCTDPEKCRYCKTKRRQRERSANGGCRNCGEPLDPGSRAYCTYHYNMDKGFRNTRRDVERQKQRNSICRYCDKQVGPTSSVFCEGHNDERRQQYANYRQERKRQGICKDCTEPVAKEGGMHCAAHLQRKRQQAHEAYKDRKANKSQPGSNSQATGHNASFGGNFAGDMRAALSTSLGHGSPSYYAGQAESSSSHRGSSGSHNSHHSHHYHHSRR